MNCTPGMRPMWRSSGAITVVAMVCALAPGICAITATPGNSIEGNTAKPISRYDHTPAIIRPMASSEVPTGRRIIGANAFTWLSLASKHNGTRAADGSDRWHAREARERCRRAAGRARPTRCRAGTARRLFPSPRRSARGGAVTQGQQQLAPGLVEVPDRFVVAVERIGQARLQLPGVVELPAHTQVGGGVTAQSVCVGRIVIAVPGGVERGADAEGAVAAVQVDARRLLGAARQHVAVVRAAILVARLQPGQVALQLPAAEPGAKLAFHAADARLADVAREVLAVQRDQLVDARLVGVQRPVPAIVLPAQAQLGAARSLRFQVRIAAA